MRMIDADKLIEDIHKRIISIRLYLKYLKLSLMNNQRFLVWELNLLIIL